MEVQFWFTGGGVIPVIGSEASGCWRTRAYTLVRPTCRLIGLHRLGWLRMRMRFVGPSEVTRLRSLSSDGPTAEKSSAWPPKRNLG